MKLTIQKLPEYNRAFIEYVKDYTKRIILKKLNVRKLITTTKYFYDNIKGKRKINAFDIVVQAAHNLTIIEYADSFIICVDRNMIVPYFNKTKIVDMCRLINYGNTDIQPYPIFTEVFREVLGKVPALYKAYQMGIRAY